MAEQLVHGPTYDVKPARLAQRDVLAEAFRDWIHESPLSQCGFGSDECPDWPLAYELADVALAAGPEEEA